MNKSEEIYFEIMTVHIESQAAERLEKIEAKKEKRRWKKKKPNEVTRSELKYLRKDFWPSLVDILAQTERLRFIALSGIARFYPEILRKGNTKVIKFCIIKLAKSILDTLPVQII